MMSLVTIMTEKIEANDLKILLNAANDLQPLCEELGTNLTTCMISSLTATGGKVIQSPPDTSYSLRDQLFSIIIQVNYAQRYTPPLLF